MIFQRKYERAIRFLRERRGNSPAALTDETLGDQIEKGDVPALILSALLVIVPVCLVLLGGASLLAYFFLVR
ncbi:MAG TPA: hypothetical protein IAB73_07185 [Candidatus Onthenecus intestinigallinarum]|uniref:Uncharacterized protein n=1 Tax=Candidatus Onthenecus intestinigallinarum TaxID=2840875 RepID=A0A9D0ZB64_9FIRM|nr:hypothetical protein [Candidatus Onthenecus intestinigallinarum]